MSKRGWTPGPWEIEQSQHGLWVGRFKDGSLREVVVYLETRELNDKAMACQIDNAHMISAAPELYEALEEAILQLGHATPDEDFKKFSAVLARARGEETK